MWPCAGQINQAIARRVGVGKHIVLADRGEANANAAAEVVANDGYHVNVATVDVSSREAVLALVGKATGVGQIVGLIHAAGISPSQANQSWRSPGSSLRVEQEDSRYGAITATVPSALSQSVDDFLPGRDMERTACRLHWLEVSTRRITCVRNLQSLVP